MIPSIDSYLHHEIESKLQIILSNRYIIEEILKGVQQKVAQNFMRAYTGDTAREIPIIYTMPQDKVTQQGAIYIGLREGEETHPSIGNIEETYDFKEGGMRKDSSLILANPEKNRLYFEVEEPIGDLINVEGLTFSTQDNAKVEANRIYFNYDPTLEGLGPFNINYTVMNGDEVGLRKGFTTTEHYSVLAISTNMDTVRCLDLIIKAILILMRDNPEELTHYLLQRLQFGQIEAIPTGTDEQPELLYGRETIVTYKVSYSLEAPTLGILEEIILSLKFK